MSSNLPAAERKRSREYAISPRLQRALAAYADGSARNQAEAAAAGGLSVRALQRALRRDNVKAHIQSMVRTTLMTASPRAADKLVALLDSPNAVASFRAATFIAGTGAGVVLPTGPGVNVQINNGAFPGMVIHGSDSDLSTAELAAIEKLSQTSGPGYIIRLDGGPRRDAPVIEHDPAEPARPTPAAPADDE